jgi:hypothetical protein
VNDLTSQFAYRLVRGDDARRRPRPGCISAVLWFIVGAAVFGILAAMRH